MGNIVFFVDLKAINRGKDDKRGYLKFYFGIASLFVVILEDFYNHFISKQF